MTRPLRLARRSRHPSRREGLICHTYFPTDPEIAGHGWPSNIPTPDTVYRLYQTAHSRRPPLGLLDLEREPITDKKNEGPADRLALSQSGALRTVGGPGPGQPRRRDEAVQKGVITEKEAAPFLAARLEPEGEGDNGNHFAELRAKVRTLQGELEQAKEELAQVKAQAAAPLKFDLVLSEEQLEKIRAELELKTGVTPETKAGAVLNAKNKAALQQAVALIQQVLTAADPASDEGKSVTPTQSIYSLALNPGDEPQGERPAGELPVDMAEILNLTKNFYQTVCPGK